MKSLFVAATIALLMFPSPAQAQNDENPFDKPGTTIVGIEYEYEKFNDIEDWHSSSLELGHKFSRISINGKVNFARRFGDDGTQYELEAYPKLWPKAYAYVGAAVSSDNVFPDSRYGLQIYQGLPASWEISAGARILDFGGSETKLYTGSIGRYWGNFYGVLQPYFADSSSREEMSRSLQALLRRYYSSGDDYLGLRAGYGEVPEVDILLQENIDLTNWNVRIERQVPAGTILVRVFAAYRDQELTLERKRTSWLGGIALRKRF